METTVRSAKEWLREVEVAVEPERLKARVAALLEEYRSRAEVPGFRPGRVPMPVMTRRFGPALESAAVEEIVEQAAAEALEQNGLKAAFSYRLADLEVTPEKAIRFRVSVEVVPEFELKPYIGLRLTRPAPTGFDAEFEHRVQELRIRCATYRPVSRPARAHDFVAVDYVVLDSGREAERKQNVLVELAGNDTPAELTSALAGARPGAERSAEVPIPRTDHNALYRLVVRDVKERLLPELDEEFARDLGFSGLDALRQAVNDDILAERERAATEELRRQATERLLADHDFEPPGSMVAAGLERLIARSGLPETEAVRTKLEPLAQRLARLDCIITRIAEREGISVTDSDLAEDAERLAAETGKPREEIGRLVSSADYRQQALRERVLKLIVDQAEISGAVVAR